MGLDLCSRHQTAAVQRTAAAATGGAELQQHSGTLTTIFCRFICICFTAAVLHMSKLLDGQVLNLSLVCLQNGLILNRFTWELTPTQFKLFREMFPTT